MLHIDSSSVAEMNDVMWNPMHQFYILIFYVLYSIGNA